MKTPKSIRETLTEEKLKEVEAMISAAKAPAAKDLMEQMLSMTYEELEVIKREMEKMIE